MTESAQHTRPSPRGAQSAQSATRPDRMRCTNCGQIASFAPRSREPACSSCGNIGFRQA